MKKKHLCILLLSAAVLLGTAAAVLSAGRRLPGYSGGPRAGMKHGEKYSGRLRQRRCVTGREAERHGDA